MLKLKYKMTLLAPVIISDSQSEQNLVSSAKFISGSSVLGAFAGEYIRSKKIKNAHEDSVFSKLFLSNNIIFSNANIASINEYGDLIKNNFLPYYLQHDKKKREEVFNLLEENFPEVITKSFNTYGRVSEEGVISKQSVVTTIQFHNVIDRVSGTTKDGEIFNYESVGKEQIFLGEIRGDEATIGLFLEHFTEVKTLHLGRSKNTQYGKVNFSIIDKEVINMDLEKSSENNRVILQLLSDTIIFNKYGYSEVSKKAMEDYLNSIPNVKLSIEKAFIKANLNESYIAVWKLKTPNERSFATGSAFLLLIESGLSELSEFISLGIGENTKAGFGEAEICNFSNNYSISLDQINGNSILAKPEGKIPEAIDFIISNRIKSKIFELIRNQALIDADTFRNERRNLDSSKKLKLSNSLIGRLEAFVKDIDNVRKFSEKINVIRKTSKDKLEKLIFEDREFIDVLKNNPHVELNFYLNNTPELVELSKLIKMDLTSEPQFALIVFKEYWMTFFGNLRKMLKTMGGNNAQ